MVSLELFEAGWCEQPEYFVTGRATTRKLRFPALAALIRHPKLGTVLFDCGYGAALAQSRHWASRVYRKILPFALGLSETLRRPDRILLSHFHPDHIGGLRDAGLAPIWHSSAGLAKLRSLSSFGQARQAFFPDLLPDDFARRACAIEACAPVELGEEWAPFRSAYDLAGDQTLLAVELPGHAIGQYGLICRLAEEDVFLVADAAWIRDNIRELLLPAPPGRLAIADFAAYRDTLQRLRQLQSSRPGLWMIPSHCETTIRAFQKRDSAVVGPREYERNFAEFNVLRVGLNEARRLAEDEKRGVAAKQFPGYSFGLSTGTTGAPGVFITNEAERRAWGRQIVRKTLRWRELLGLRAALLLRHDNRLYRERRLGLRYFSLEAPVETWLAELEAYAPTVLAGPPSALEAVGVLARFKPKVLLAGGEALAPGDAERLREIFGVTPRIVYQAKEGFLAAGEVGRLKWNEELVELQRQHFRVDEWRFVPVVTDQARQTQRFVRYRMDDVLRMDEGGIVEVEGRLTDVLYAGARGLVFPGEVHSAVGSGDYELEQNEAKQFRFAGNADLEALENLLGARIERVARQPRELWQKRRRVRRSFDFESEWITEKFLHRPCR